MSNRIHHLNANTISHLSQEAPLPFKKYTKKRSWIWDWFEQDPNNKFRAVCVYCHQEIFRLDGDKGSPKKLITHLNSKHLVNKDNCMGAKLSALRQEKLKLYEQQIGPLVTNKDDVISEPRSSVNLRANNALKNNGYRQSASPPATAEDEGTMKFINIIQSKPQTPQPSHQNNQSYQLRNLKPQQNYTPPSQNYPIQQPYQQQLHQQHQHEHQQLEPLLKLVVQPSLAAIDPEIKTIKPLEPVDDAGTSLVYNGLVERHNEQVEEYNKIVVVRNSIKPKHLQRKFLLKINENSPKVNLNLAGRGNNKSQKSLSKFIKHNAHCFNSLSFLEDKSFREFIRAVRANPEDVI